MKIFFAIYAWLWRTESSFLLIRRFIQTVIRLVEHVLEDEFRERAQSLAYTTLLSLVPLIAVSFSILKSFGVHQHLMPILDSAFKPLGERGPEAVRVLVSFVENVQVKVLGVIGLVVLFYTVVSLFSSIETQFNKIWGIEKGRTLGRRISDFLVISLVGPVLIFAAISLLSSHIVVNVLGYVPVKFTSFINQTTFILLLTIVMAFIYSFITHKHVNVFPALTGGFFAAVSWLTIGNAFAHFVATSANYSGVYSGFASVILFMLWTYISWLIVLVGNQLSCYVQYPERLSKKPSQQYLSGNSTSKQKIKLLIELEEVDSLNNIWIAKQKS